MKSLNVGNPRQPRPSRNVFAFEQTTVQVFPRERWPDITQASRTGALQRVFFVKEGTRRTEKRTLSARRSWMVMIIANCSCLAWGCLIATQWGCWNPCTPSFNLWSPRPSQPFKSSLFLPCFKRGWPLNTTLPLPHPPSRGYSLDIHIYAHICIYIYHVSWMCVYNHRSSPCTSLPPPLVSLPSSSDLSVCQSSLSLSPRIRCSCVFQGERVRHEMGLKGLTVYKLEGREGEGRVKLLDSSADRCLGLA